MKEESEKRDFKTFVSVAKWAYKKLYSLSRRDFIALIITGFLVGTLPTLSVYVNSRILNELIDGIVRYSQSGIESFVPPVDIMKLILISASISYVITLIEKINDIFTVRFTILHQATLEIELYKKISKLSMQDFESPGVSDMIYKARDNLQRLNSFLITSNRILAQAFGIIAAGVVVFIYSKLLFLFLILTALPSAYLYAKNMFQFWDFYNKHFQKFRLANFVKTHLLAEKALPENLIHDSAKYEVKYLKNVSKFIRGNEYKFRLGGRKIDIFTRTVDFIKDLITQFYVIARVIVEKATIGDYQFYTNRALNFKSELTGIFSQFVTFYDHTLGIRPTKDVMNLEPIVKGGKLKIKKNQKLKIEFRDVYFKYPRSKKYALEAVSFTINPNDEIAFVGENGAGKSTLINLILRFYDPQKGQILINDVDIQEYDLRSYYNNMGVIFQDFNRYLFLTAKENIHISRDDPEDMKKIIESAKLAEIHNDINRLPLKYDQLLTKTLKGGTNLSTGQMQKLSLARVFYRDAPILILDEPTASIDAQAEHKIFNKIYDFIDNKTVIIISHRFSTVRNAQKIYVLDKGKIIEQGSHEELMKIGGKYANAYNLQAKGYKD